MSAGERKDGTITALPGFQFRLQCTVMAYKNRDNAEEHKNVGGLENNAFGQSQISELGVWLLALRAKVQGAPLAIEGGIKSARVGDGCFTHSFSSYPPLFRFPAFSDIMVKPRQRLISRRGSGRGGSSRPSVANAPSCYCRCLCHQVAEAHPIQASQFMDSGNPDSGSNPIPAFGSAVFSFSNAQGNSRINAHVFVLFWKNRRRKARSHLAHSFIRLKAAGQLRVRQRSPRAEHRPTYDSGSAFVTESQGRLPPPRRCVLDL